MPLMMWDLPQACILSLTAEQGDAARSWLLQADGVDLVIPYGRPSLVQQVVRGRLRCLCCRLPWATVTSIGLPLGNWIQ
jgi:hypothetical protein